MGLLAALLAAAAARLTDERLGSPTLTDELPGSLHVIHAVLGVLARRRGATPLEEEEQSARRERQPDGRSREPDQRVHDFAQSTKVTESVCYERSETAAGFSAEDLKRAEAQWRE